MYGPGTSKMICLHDSSNIHGDCYTATGTLATLRESHTRHAMPLKKLHCHGALAMPLTKQSLTTYPATITQPSFPTHALTVPRLTEFPFIPTVKYASPALVQAIETPQKLHKRVLIVSKRWLLLTVFNSKVPDATIHKAI